MPNSVKTPVGNTEKRKRSFSFGKPDVSVHGPSLVLHLKTMIKDLQKEVKKKDEEIEILKKTSKNVKLVEVQIVNERLFEEVARLKATIDAKGGQYQRKNSQ